MEKKKIVEIEGNTVEEAVKNGLEELNTTIENVDIEIINESISGVFKIGSKKAKVRISLIDNGIDDVEEKENKKENKTNIDEEKKILDIFKHTTEYMGFDDINPEIVNLNDKYRIIVKDVKDASLLIGKNGKTIDALQNVVNKIYSSQGGECPVYIDIKGYVKQKSKNKKWKKEKQFLRR